MPSMAAWRMEKIHRSGGRDFLFRLSASRRAQCFTARSYLYGRSMHPLRDGEMFSILYWRREADDETTGTSTAIEGDE
jgi:hypothetical protein